MARSCMAAAPARRVAQCRRMAELCDSAAGLQSCMAWRRCAPHLVHPICSLLSWEAFAEQRPAAARCCVAADCCTHAISAAMSVACSQRWRETSAEKRELARLDNDLLQEVRQAAEVHRQVSLGLLTVLSCCEGAVAAKPLQTSPVRQA